MCAKFGGDWDKNDLNMDLKMSAGPFFVTAGHPNLALFSNYLLILNIFGRKYLLLFVFPA